METTKTYSPPASVIWAGLGGNGSSGLRSTSDRAAQRDRKAHRQKGLLTPLGTGGWLGVPPHEGCLMGFHRVAPAIAGAWRPGVRYSLSYSPGSKTLEVKPVRVLWRNRNNGLDIYWKRFIIKTWLMKLWGPRSLVLCHLEAGDPGRLGCNSARVQRPENPRAEGRRRWMS